MVLSLDRIEAAAPDQASLDAARKLLKPAVWPTLACDDAGLVWGEAQGSGATPYRVIVAESDGGYKCTCPSRKFPCKHSLALMWLRAEGRVAFATAPAPEWVEDWLARRRGPAAPKAEAPAAPKASIAATVEAEPEALDPKAEVRAAAQRERNRLEREASILAALDEWDVWLADQVDRGMAAFVADATAACRRMAERLVDAKASGLATRLDALPSRLFALPEPRRPTAAVEELGALHLVAEAYRRQADLPAPLREDVRQAVGWTVTREALLADPSALRAAGRWHVVATRSEVQPDRLRRTETWLWRKAEGGPAFALLLDFVPVSVGAASAGYALGDGFDGELAFYPSAAPLRALVAGRSGPTAFGEGLPDIPAAGLAAAWSDFERALAARPWLETWPLAFRGARVRRSGDALVLADPGDPGLALPIVPEQATSALPLAAVERIDGIALWDGRRARLSLAETPIGRWVDA